MPWICNREGCKEDIVLIEVIEVTRLPASKEAYNVGEVIAERQLYQYFRCSVCGVISNLPHHIGDWEHDSEN